MKKLFIAFFLLIPSFAFAGSGFDQLVSLFDQGTSLNVGTLQMIDSGMYIGRCFTTESAVPAGAFLVFKNEAIDTGPIQVDPELKLVWGSQANSKAYDTLPVKDVVNQARLMPAALSLDGISHEVEYLQWTVQFRANANYIIQRNLEYGEATSYCYYYSFRSL